MPPQPVRRSGLSHDGADDGTQLLHADLHNHSLLSDGAGDPERAFALMRAAGLDVAALTDHASIPRARLHEVESGDYPDESAYQLALTAPYSLDDDGWKLTAELADAADVPGEFTAIRGFEWTEPWLGHANVWFSDDYLDVTTPGRIAGLHEWLREESPQALFGYNHPGREPGTMHEFRLDPAVADRMVALELFNRTDDYLFEGWTLGRPSPLVTCLDAGWRPGLVGVSDEHSRSYGLVGKGRTGLWAPTHDRAGVRAALLARRSYATREVGLLLDATLGGLRMGSTLRARGRVELAVEVRGGAYDGRTVELQVLGSTPGEPAPTVHLQAPATGGTLTRVDLDVPTDARWLVLRVADPARPNPASGPYGHPGNAYAVAYASPWWRED